MWHSHSWKAILVESNPSRYQRLIKDYGHKDNVTIISKFLSVSGENSVDQLALKFLPSNITDIGVLSIDIDSFDYHVFKNIKRIKPMIVLVEFNNSIPAHIDYFDPLDELFLRCSAKALERIGNTKGYKLVATTVTNAILLRKDCFDPKKHPEAPIEYLFDYEGQAKNNSQPTHLINSQLITSYPIFSKKINTTIKLLFIIRGWFKSIARRSEPWKKPSKKIIKRIKEAGMSI